MRRDQVTEVAMLGTEIERTRFQDLPGRQERDEAELLHLHQTGRSTKTPQTFPALKMVWRKGTLSYALKMKAALTMEE